MTTDTQKHDLVPYENLAVIRTKTGEARLFVSKIILSTVDKTLIHVPGMSQKVVHDGKESWMPVYLCSAEGYKEQAAASGLITVCPPTVVVDGVEQPNPYVFRDKQSGRIKAVTCRAITYGFSKMGIPIPSDRTVNFDIHQYRLKDLLAKAKKLPNEFKLMATGSTGPDGWIAYPVDDYLTLWANPSAKEFISWVGQMVNREQKATEIAQTFAIRNSIKHHPNIKLHTSMTATVDLRLACWRPTDGSIRWDASQWECAVDRITGAASGRADKALPVGEVISGVDNLHEDPALLGAEVVAGAGEDDAVIEVDSEEKEPEPEQIDDKPTLLINQINALADAVGNQAFIVAAEKIGIKMQEGGEWESASESKLIKLLNELAKLNSKAKKDKGGQK